MTNHPIERLRNKLSPFITVVEMLGDSPDRDFFKDETLNAIFNKSLDQCLANKKEIDQHLKAAGALITIEVKEIEPQASEEN